MHVKDKDNQMKISQMIIACVRQRQANEKKLYEKGM